MRFLIAICILGVAYGSPSWLLERLARIEKGEKDSGDHPDDSQKAVHQLPNKKLSVAVPVTDQENKDPLGPLVKLCVAIELKELFESQVVKDVDEETEGVEKRNLLEKLKAIDSAYPDKSMMPKPDNKLVEDLIEELCKTVGDFFDDAFPDVPAEGKTARALMKLSALHALQD